MLTCTCTNARRAAGGRLALALRAVEVPAVLGYYQARGGGVIHTAPQTRRVSSVPVPVPVPGPVPVSPSPSPPPSPPACNQPYCLQPRPTVPPRPAGRPRRPGPAGRAERRFRGQSAVSGRDMFSPARPSPLLRHGSRASSRLPARAGSLGRKLAAERGAVGSPAQPEPATCLASPRADMRRPARGPARACPHLAPALDASQQCQRLAP